MSSGVTRSWNAEIREQLKREATATRPLRGHLWRAHDRSPTMRTGAVGRAEARWTASAAEAQRGQARGPRGRGFRARGGAHRGKAAGAPTQAGLRSAAPAHPREARIDAAANTSQGGAVTDGRYSSRQKLEAEIARLRAEAEKRLAQARTAHPERMQQLESRIEAAKAKLAELAEAGEGRWGELKRRVEARRNARKGRRRPRG